MNKSLFITQCSSKLANKCQSHVRHSCCTLLGLQQKRGIRFWRRGLPFPGNFRNDHHVMFPSLKQYLMEKTASENPVKLINIGMQEVAKKLPKKTLSGKTERTESELKSEDEILKLLSTKTEVTGFDYKLFSQTNALSKEGQEATVNIAHHYGIYRDLFTSSTQALIENSLPKIKQFDYFPRIEKEIVNCAAEWFPGARRWKAPEPKPIYYFHPVAPIYAEFAVPESELIVEDHEAIAQLSGNVTESVKSDENLEISSVYRGNIIRPQFAKYKPNVVIDARSIGTETIDTNETINVDTAGIKIIGDKDGYYTVCLFNLDSQFGDTKPLCHWQVSNIKCDEKSQTSQGEEVVSYLPVYGIRGLGYHRYVFLVCRHEKPLNLPKIDDFDLRKRISDPLEFLKKENATPVGLSWFQTTWDHSCQHIFHHVLNMRAPVYEWIQPEFKLAEQVQYPEKTPFNVYLDHFRDPKEINKSVLLERLKSIHPFEYEKQIEPRKLPANIYKYPFNSPSWMRSTYWKRANQFGPFRYLRPVSALKPLENNADLDKPFWPPPKIAELPMKWPRLKRTFRPLRETRWALPPQDHPSVQIFNEDTREIREQEEKEERKAKKHIKI